MNDAQRRVQRIRAFRAELESLTAAGVTTLNDEQRARITQYHDTLLRRLAAEYDIDTSDRAGQLSRGIRITAFVAAIALAAAIYSLVERFWGRLELPLQATLLCAFPLAALVGVELSAQRERTLYVASIFALVAFGTYWLAVFELGELLNLPVTTPALWGGALFGVALALPYGFRVIYGGALVALLVALAGSVFQALGTPWTVVPEFPEIITAAAFMLFVISRVLWASMPTLPPYVRATIVSLDAVTRLVSLGVVFLGLLFLSLAGPASLLPVSSQVSVLIYQAIMLVVATAVLVAATRRQWHETVYLAAVALTVFLFTRFVDWFWEVIPRFAFFLLLAIVAFAWLFVLRRMRRRLAATEAR
jgi:hypothetical protein